MKILFVEPIEWILYSFRKELLDTLIEQKHEIHLAVGCQDRVIRDYSSKIKIYDIPGNLRSISPIGNFKLLKKYQHLIRRVQPDVILTFTIKPNIYCNLRKNKAHTIANITGLGTSFNRRGTLRYFVVSLYRKAFKNVDCIMFQNQNGIDVFKQMKISSSHYELIPGSGVNTEKFILSPLDKHDGCNFLFASRLLKEKGIDVLLKALPKVFDEFPNSSITILKNKSQKYDPKISKLVKKYPSQITIVSKTNNMLPFYQNADFLVSPSFYKEGISNILLESLACGRPIITTNDNPGCMEVLQEGRNGYGVKSNDVESLINAMKKACQTPKDVVTQMGKDGHEFVKENFNRQKMIEAYLRQIDNN